MCCTKTVLAISSAAPAQRLHYSDGMSNYGKLHIINTATSPRATEGQHYRIKPRKRLQGTRSAKFIPKHLLWRQHTGTNVTCLPLQNFYAHFEETSTGYQRHAPRISCFSMFNEELQRSLCAVRYSLPMDQLRSGSVHLCIMRVVYYVVKV